MSKSGRLFGVALASVLLAAALFALLFSSFGGGQEIPTCGLPGGTGNFTITGIVLNSTFGNASTNNASLWNMSNHNVSVNVSLYNMSFSNFGEPQRTFVNQTSTNGSGAFVLWVPSGNCAALYSLSVIAYNISSWNAIEIGPSLPPVPAAVLMTFLNKSTIYLQRAVTINLTAWNGSDMIAFSNIVFDDALGFPISEDFNTLRFNSSIVVPRAKNYTIMMMRPPQFSGPGDPFATALPPQTITVTNISNYSAAQAEVVMSFNKSLAFTQNTIVGNITVEGNTTAVNVTQIILRLGIAGLVPPNSALQIPNSIFFNNSGVGYVSNYSVVVLGASSGIYQLLEVYGANATATSSGIGEYFGFFGNFTVTGNMGYNINLKRLAGSYTVVSGFTNLNTSYITINISDSGGTPLDDAHVEIKVSPVGHLTNFTTFRYMVDQLSGGIIRLPILNDSNATIHVFNRQYAPLKFKLNITNASREPNGIIQVKLNTFSPKKFQKNGSFEDFSGSKAGQFKLTFMRNSDACNVFNASIDNCRLFKDDFDAGGFNPLKVMATGKVNLLMELNATGVKMYFIGVDMLASGPPDGSMSDSATRATSNSSSSFQEIFKFGSAAPNIYDMVAVGIPYNYSRMDDSKTVNFSFKGLYNDAGQMVWNGSQSSNVSIPADWVDYSTAWFNSTYGMPCIDYNVTTIVNQTCFINTTTNYIWVSLPHFTDGEAGPQGGDTTPPLLPLLSLINVTLGGNVVINWTDSPNETGERYLIFRSETNISTLWNNLTNYTGINYVINVTNLTSSTDIGENVQTFTDNTTVNGSRFFYAVAAVDASGNWQNTTPQGGVNISNSYNVTVNDTVLPRVPGNITLSASNLVVTVSWLNVTQDVRGEADNYNITYYIYRTGASQGANLSMNSANLTLSNITSFVKSIAWTAANSTTVTLTDNGTYHFAVFTADDGGNTNFSVLTPGNVANITVTAAAGSGSSSSSSSGGGGGGGGTPSVSEGVKFTKSWDSLPVGVASVKLTKEEIGFTAIDFTVVNPLTSPSLTIVKLDKAPTLKRDVVGKIYQSIRIDEKNIRAADVSEAKIEFKVEKKWFDQNSGSVKNIVLQRYSSDLWTSLDTKYLRFDDIYQYFEATSPGLSNFAIVLKAPSSGSSSSSGSAGNATVVNESSVAKNASAKPEEKGGLNASSKKALVFVVLALAIAAVGGGAFMLIRKKGGGSFSLPNPFSRFGRGGGKSSKASQKSEEAEAAEIVKEYEQQRRPSRQPPQRDQRGRPPEAFN